MLFSKCLVLLVGTLSTSAHPMPGGCQINLGYGYGCGEKIVIPDAEAGLPVTESDPVSESGQVLESGPSFIAPQNVTTPEAIIIDVAPPITTSPESIDIDVETNSTNPKAWI